MSWLFNYFLWSFHVCCDVHLTYGFQNPVHKWEGMRTKQWLICHAHSHIFCNGKAQHHLLVLKHPQTVSILHQVNISWFGLFVCLFKSQFSVSIQVLSLERWGAWTLRSGCCSGQKYLSDSNLAWGTSKDSQTCHSSNAVFCSRENWNVFSRYVSIPTTFCYAELHFKLMRPFSDIQDCLCHTSFNSYPHVLCKLVFHTN